MEEAEPLLLTFVLGCYQPVSKFECRGFKWTIQGHEFVTDVRIVELRECDMVIGRNWLSSYCTLQLTWNNVIVFEEEEEVVLQIEEDQLSCAKDKQEE
ncbi:hypothetical protein ACH5RR_022959 [Cinchona calisaya]|uniref:Uncharacterized protein n=1 Tax=Cinchona calisaya TaxID=153742 RepID=A0ABD2Z9A9_9GENT